MNNIRQLRLAQDIKKLAIEFLLKKGLSAPELFGKDILITEVSVNHDLSLARFYIYSNMHKASLDSIVASLNKNHYDLKKHLAQKLTLRIMPNLIFAKDETFDSATNIDNLLKQAISSASKSSDDEERN